jgi:hypothetical protein
LFLATVATANDDSTRIGFTFGVASTNWDTQASTGIVYKLNDSWANFTFADIGGGLVAFQTQPVLLFPIDDHLSLGFFVGPEVAIYQEAPSIEEKVIYLNAATGVVAWIDLPPRISILISAEHITSDAPISRYRLGLRGVVWLH